MALDKLVDSTQLDTDLTSVADAIRAKSGTSGQLQFPGGFVDAIDAIETGGGYVAEDFFDQALPTGAIVYNGTAPNNNSTSYFNGRTAITRLFLPNWNDTQNRANAFANMPNLEYAVLPKNTKIYNTAFANDTKLKAVDFLGSTGNGFSGSSMAFSAANAFKVLVIRLTSGVCKLNNIAVFSSCPFASGKAGGTLYVPQDLIASYQAATNWSTILGYANNRILPIEGSIYETQYADGTPIT